MKTITLPFFIWLSLVTVCSAQIDSITTQNYQLREYFWSQFINNPSVGQNLPIADFTETSLYATVKNQEFSKTQNPNKVNYYGFNSKGIFTLKNNFKLFGNLNFSRSYTKETSHLLFQNISDEFTDELFPTTNYPLAIRSGDNENLHYKLKGGITGYITKKLPFSVTIDYNLNKFYGLTIPKTEQEVIDYSSFFEVGYQLKNNTFFTFLKLQKEQNNFTTNQESATSIPINIISEPDYYAGFSVGYGDVLGYNGTLLAGLVENNTQQFGVGYNYSFENTIFSFKYTRKQNKEHYYATAYRDENNLAALFKRTQNTFEASYIKNHQSKYLLIDGVYTFGNATNTHGFENFVENSANLIVKSNYEQQVKQGKLNITWQKRKDNLTLWSTTLHNTFEENNIEDYNTTQKKLISFTTAISINRDFRLNEKSFINLETGISYYTPLSNSLIYNSQNSTTSNGSIIPPSTTFGATVIGNDYNFDTLKKGGSIFNIMYQQKTSKNRTVTICFNYSFLTVLQSNSNTKSNNNFGLRLNLQY